MTRRPNPADDTEPGFIRRWSQRKLQTEQADHGAGETAPAAPSTGSAAEVEPSPPAAEPVKTDADMPPVETIDETSSIADFFSPGVSEDLRQAALQRLFRLPKYNVMDGLDDYDDDFRTFQALGDIITSDMRHQLEVEAERAREQAEQQLAEQSAETAAESGAPETDVVTDEEGVEGAMPDDLGDEVSEPGSQVREGEEGDDRA